MAPRIDILLGLVTTGFAKGISAVKRQLNSLVPSDLGRALGVTAIAHFSKSALAAADDVATFANRTGMSIRATQELKFAAQETDTTLEAFATAYRTLVQAQADAASGRGKEQIESFHQLGVSMKELQHLSPEQLFWRVADAIKKGGREGSNLNASISLLGRSSLEVIPAMQQGLDGLAASAHAFGMVLQDDVVTRLADANDNIDRLIQRAKIGIGSAVGWVMEKVEFAGSYWGARAGGASSSEAIRMATKFEAEDKAARAADRAAKAAKPVALSPVAEAEKVKQQAISFALPAADALARLGLFRGGYDAAQRTREQQLRALKEMETALKSIDTEMKA